MAKTMKLNDCVKFNDKINSNGIWATTEVIGGYGEIHNNPNGKSTLDEEIFRTKNIVPIGGVSYVMEQMFGVKDSQIEVPTVYSTDNIGIINSGNPSETYDVPGGTKSPLYRHGHYVQLFGIGITGTAENDISIYKPDYRENGIKLSKVNADGLTVTGTILPFRFTQAVLNSQERLQYFGKKTNPDGVTGYYLKRFENDPVIKHIWKTGEDIIDEENEVLVPTDSVWSNTAGLNTVETFTEFFLKINKKDVKEWFINIEQEDRTRINTLALFTGQYVKGSNPADYGDYRDVRLFSKLCINPEYLNLNKDLNIIYRVYGA